MFKNNTMQKTLLIIIGICSVVAIFIGGSFAYWTWKTSSAQQTAITFTISSGFSCSADGGGDITSSDVMLAPSKCTNSKYAIKRTVKVSTTQDAGRTIYLDMNLKVKSIGTGLANSQNFKYALTTSSTSCETGVVAEGNFYGAAANTEKPLLSEERYTQTTANDTYYLWIWLDEEETNSATMNQSFAMTLTGSCTDQEPPAITSSWGEIVDKYTKVDFSKTSVDNGTNGLYLLKSTKNDTNPVYYYRGNVDNNVLFGGFCWKIVRTTSTGGTKLIYNGLPTGTNNNECNNTGTASQLASTTRFNNNFNSLADVGYMYGTRYILSSKSASKLATSYKYGNSFTYSGGTYTLKDTIDSAGTWTTDYKTLNNNHYTCFNTTGTCTSVYYIYYTNTSYAYYITLQNGASVEDVLDEMLTNTTNSAIKTVIDSWYSTNLTSYTSYLEDTIWCNDRSISELNGWNPNGGDTTKLLYFGPYTRAYTTYSPSITCASNDSFTISNSNGNGKLAYPVGLLTTDEIMMAGGRYGQSNSSYYLYTNQNVWAGSPNYFDNYYANEFYVYSTGSLGTGSVFNTFGARPAVSLKPGAIWSGSGTTENPYTVRWS